jgi:hypothetical protein
MVKLRLAAVAAVAIGTGLLGACGHRPASPSVPTLAGSHGASGASGGTGKDDSGRVLNGTTGDASAARRTALHKAADCIRQHGAPNYQDPVLTTDGRVYTDEVALRNLDEAASAAIETACGEMIRAAKFSPDDQAPPPPKLIQAGVKSAQCMRSHGLPDYKDPTASSPFAPGKGFGLDSTSIPAAGKQDPTVQRALTACRSILDEEARLSTLGSLADA